MLTGHGSFGAFLFRIGKAISPICVFCREGVADDAAHTLGQCSAWDEERTTLNRTLEVEEDLNLPSVVRAICESSDAWLAFAQFCDTVMTVKERCERENERARRGGGGGPPSPSP